MRIISNRNKSNFLVFIKRNFKPVSITFFFTAILFSFLPKYAYEFVLLRYKDLNNIYKFRPTQNDYQDTQRDF